MSDTNELAPVPAGGAAPEENKTPAQEQAEVKDYVTLADDDVEDDVDEEADEQDGDKGEAEDAAPPRRKSGAARAKERIQALQREIEDLRRGQVRAAPAAEDDDLKEPKEADFPNDYLAYDRAMRAYETKKAIRDEKKRDAAADAKAREETDHRTRQAGFTVRLEAVKDRIPDYDKVMAQAGRMEIRSDVRDLILDSSKGPLLAYHLAKNPDRVAELNRMSPTSAAKEIGSLEARLRGPQPKTVTKAKPAAAPPKGGQESRAPDPASMSMEQYVEARKAGRI